MPTQQDRNYWNNTVGNPYEPLTFRGETTAEERVAHAAEYTAHFIYEINAKLGEMLRLMREHAGEPE